MQHLDELQSLENGAVGQAVLGWVMLGHLNTVHSAWKAHFPQKSHLTCMAMLGYTVLGPGHGDRRCWDTQRGDGILGHHDKPCWDVRHKHVELPGYAILGHTAATPTFHTRIHNVGTCHTGTRSPSQGFSSSAFPPS